MSQPQHLGDAVVPVQVLSVNIQEIPRGKGPPGRMENIKRLVYKLTELAKTFVN